MAGELDLKKGPLHHFQKSKEVCWRSSKKFENRKFRSWGETKNVHVASGRPLTRLTKHSTIPTTRQNASGMLTSGEPGNVPKQVNGARITLGNGAKWDRG